MAKTPATRRAFILLSLLVAWPAGALRTGEVISGEDSLGVK
jgi:hypothetical protein